MDDSELQVKIEQLTERLNLLVRQFKLDVEAVGGDKEKIRAIIARHTDLLNPITAESDALYKIYRHGPHDTPPASNT